jgi:transposase
MGVEVVLEQLKTVEAGRDALLKLANDAGGHARAVEGYRLGNRRPPLVGGPVPPIRHRRQVAAYAGLAPTPWQSGSIDHEQVCPRRATRGLGQQWSSSPG